ncbi:MAG: plastocyanin/azurin family copper-binding protein [Nitrosopumilus sp.]|nr:plastocyanin/azurin family copper-binding protein [Nitrosopumilus sp.]MDH5568902.1 plastocyanin/azurin family copper-binding protein [Nitrosopumilus sp.]
MDKMGIIVTSVVVAVALGFLLTDVAGISLDISPSIEKTTTSIKETTEKLKISESGKEIVEKTYEKTKQVSEQVKEMGQAAKELSSSKLPARLVSIPSGTSVPGCEKDGICYDPPSLIIFTGAELIWKNNDSSSHTVTSGNIVDGPDGLFDSGLIMSNETFSHTFNEAGEYAYFCMIHPWANASVTVK